VTDGDGSGVDLSTLEYKIDMPGDTSTGWLSAGREGIATRATVSVGLTAFSFPEGTSWVSWRAQDTAGTPMGYSAASPVQISLPVVRHEPPHLILRSPTPGEHYRAGVDIAFDASPTRDLDSSALVFTWSIDGRPRTEHGDRIWVTLAPGEHTLTVVVSDGLATDDLTIRFTVDAPAAPPSALGGPAAVLMLVTFGALVGSAFAMRVWVARARRALYEP